MGAYEQGLHEAASRRVYTYGTGTNGEQKTALNVLNLMKTNSDVFGAPPQFNHIADPRYYKEIDIGRVYSTTYMASPTILSLEPCSAKFAMAGGVGGKEEPDTLKNLIIQLSNGQVKEDDFSKGGGDKIYTTDIRYNEYINTVNYCMRAISIYLGIEKRRYPGSAHTYLDFDWSLRGDAADRLAHQMYRPPGSPYAYYDSSNGVGIFDRLKKDANIGNLFNPEWYNKLSEGAQTSRWIHFYLNSDGTSITESATTTTTQSMIASQMQSSLSGLSKEINFLLGTNYGAKQTDGSWEEDFDAILNNEKVKSSGFLERLFRTGRGYLGGGKMIFPEIIDDCKFDKSMTVNLKFIAPYGDVEDIYLHCFAPLIHLLPFVFPQQYDRNMYTFPFLCKVSCKGFFNSDMCVISNFQFTKGGSDNKAYNAQGLPKEIDVSFDITPLYNVMMLPDPIRHQFASFNTALNEYLAVLCGVDLTVRNFDLESEMVKLEWNLDNTFSQYVISKYRNIIMEIGSVVTGAKGFGAQVEGMVDGIFDSNIAQSIGSAMGLTMANRNVTPLNDTTTRGGLTSYFDDPGAV